MNDEKRKKLHYKKNYKITDPNLVKLDDNDTDLFDNERDNRSKNNKIEDNEINDFENENIAKLTTSPLPGTTIGITKINSMSMGVKVKIK